MSEIYAFQIFGPKRYGFTPEALPERLRYRPYKVVCHTFEPDGGTYKINDLEIPTGYLRWSLEFSDEMDQNPA